MVEVDFIDIVVGLIFIGIISLCFATLVYMTLLIDI